MLNFKSLSQFYTSSEWRKFRQVVIAERINKKDGILYDEYNGQPLLKSYDIILHHIEELTMQNVNDPSVSLNPANIMIVSMKSHNEIHKRFGGRVQTWQRKVYCVFGAVCSGKSTFVRENMERGDCCLDMDLLWEAISLQEAHNKPSELKSVIFSVRNAILDSIKTRNGKWQTAWVISAEPFEAQRQRMLDMLGAEPIYIDTPKEVCLQRLYENPNGRDIKQYEGFINEYFDNVRKYA